MQESSGKHYYRNGKVRISKKGAVGKWQIMPIGLKQYNDKNKNKFTTNSLHNEWANRIIGKYLLHAGIRYFYNSGYNAVDSILLGINSYNYGIKNTREGKIYFTYCLAIVPSYFNYFIVRRSHNITNVGTRILKLKNINAKELYPQTTLF